MELRLNIFCPLKDFYDFPLGLLLKTVPLFGFARPGPMADTKKLNGSFILTLHDSWCVLFSQMVRPMMTSIDALVQVLDMMLRTLVKVPLPHQFQLKPAFQIDHRACVVRQFLNMWLGDHCLRLLDSALCC